MPVLRLTDLAIQRLKPSGKQVLYYCDQTANFGLRLSQAGGKTFFVNVGTGRKRVSLGKYPATSLKDAREEAKRVLFVNRSWLLTPSVWSKGAALHMPSAAR